MLLKHSSFTFDLFDVNFDKLVLFFQLLNETLANRRLDVVEFLREKNYNKLNMIFSTETTHPQKLVTSINKMDKKISLE